jgi:hypothetical protein
MEERVNHDEDKATVAENIESLFESATEYGKTSIDLFKLKAADKSAEIISSLVAGLVLVIIMIICFAILTVGLALLIGDLLGKSYYGFFILGGFYLVIGLIFLSMKDKWCKTPVADLIIKKLFK